MLKFIFLLFIFLFNLTACSSPDNDSINVGLNTAPVTLDPRFSTDAVSYRITRLIYKSLVDFNEQFQAVPDLADWQQISLTHYRFTLRDKGRVFHDGSYLTANDVKATYASLLDETSASPHRGSLEMIESMKVIDDDTIEFYLSQPDPLFPGRLVLGILPASLIASNHPFNKEPIGSGPMQFLKWDDESKLSLHRLKDKQQIQFITVKNPTVRVLKLLRGEIDLVQGDLTPEIVKWLSQRDSIHVKKKRGNTFTYIGFNLENEITGNKIIRQAIAHAIDRDAIIKYVMDDTARKAGALFPPEHWVGEAGLTGFNYDPEESKALLKQEGYDLGHPLVLTYKTSNNPFRLRLATIIQDQLKSVGIDIDIRSYDWGTFYGDIKAGNFQIYSLSWVGLKMPDIFRYVFHSTAVPPNGANRGRLHDKRVDKLIEIAEVEPSLKLQAAYYRELQEYLIDVLPYVPLWYEDNVLAVRKEIKNYTLSADGNFDALNEITRINNP